VYDAAIPTNILKKKTKIGASGGGGGGGSGCASNFAGIAVLAAHDVNIKSEPQLTYADLH
jgi:hypothetical protein